MLEKSGFFSLQKDLLSNFAEENTNLSKNDNIPLKKKR